jgi:SprB repeat/CUB domain
LILTNLWYAKAYCILSPTVIIKVFRQMLRLLPLLIFFSLLLDLSAQTYNMNNQTINTCSGNFYDSGGSGGNYGNNQNRTMTFCSNNSQCISFAFTFFNCENNDDFLYAYDGPNSGGVLIGAFTGTALPPNITSSTGCITFVFQSDGSATRAGWAASISCTPDCAPPPNSVPNNCVTATKICGNSSLNNNSSGFGIDEFPSGVGCLASGEHQSSWYEFTVSSAGTLAFNIVPAAGSGQDYDFALWGPNPSCGSLGLPVRCSYANLSCAFCPNTGLGNGATDVSEGEFGNGYVAPMNVNVGETYILLVDNFFSSLQGFSLNFTGTALLGGLTANAGPDITTCAGGNFALNGSQMGGGIPTYQWTASPSSALAYLSDPTVLAPLVNIPANYSGGAITYTLKVIENTCLGTDQVTVNIASLQVAGVPTNASCGLSNGAINITPSGSAPPYTFAWDNGLVSEDLTNLPAGTYAVTVSDGNGCTGTASFNISTTLPPTINPPSNITTCTGYALPPIAGNNIPAGTTYWTGPNGTGTQIAVGTNIITSQTIYIFANAGAGCTAQQQFTVTAGLPSTNNIVMSKCAGQTLTVNGVTFGQANPTGSTTLVGGNYRGCDSIINVNLTFFPPAIKNITQTLCQGGSIIVNGTTFNSGNPTGQIVIPNGSFRGCDSTINISLSFSSSAINNVTQMICGVGASLTFGGTVFNAGNPSGTITIPNGSYLGCDSIINVNLTIKPVSPPFNLVASLCAGQSVTIGGTVYNAANPSGNQFLPGGGYNGCDSTVNISLSFYPPSVNNLTATVCQGQSFTVGGTVFNATNTSGSVVIPNGSFRGCDSTINVILTITPPKIGNLNTTICAGQSVTIGGTIYNAANPTGTQQLPGAGAGGCDSIVNINLNFYPPAVGNVTATICQGASVTINGVLYNAANTSGSTILPNASFRGCDSTVNVIVTVTPPKTGNLTATICADESVTLNGTVYNAANPTGTQQLPGAGAGGCDSIVNVNLSFYPPSIGNVSNTICQGTSVTINGVLYNAANTSGSTILPNASFRGCDSTVNVIVTVTPPKTGNLTATICADESVTLNGTVYNAANPTGTQQLPGAGAGGCDSIVNVNLSFYPPSIGNVATTICQGTSVTINGVLYNAANTSGSTILPNASFRGCDSTVNVIVTITPPKVGNLTKKICEDDQITLNGTVYNLANPTGMQQLPSAGVGGCDSVVNVSLSFYPPAIGTYTTSICQGQSVTIHGIVYNSANTSGVKLLPNASFRGCDSTVNISVTIIPPNQGNYTSTLCANKSVTINGTLYNASHPSGSEILSGAGVGGCDSVVNVSLSFIPLPQGNYTDLLCLSESVTLYGSLFNSAHPTGQVTIPNGSFTGCDSLLNVNITFAPPTVGNYSASTCPGRTIFVNGTAYNVGHPSGQEFFPGGSYTGCDSVLNVLISFVSPPVGALYPLICQGTSITVNGHVYNAAHPSGTETLVGGAFNGCDSTFIVDIDFFPKKIGHIYPTVCQGESIVINGETFNASNTNSTQILPNANVYGCDSTLIVDLEIIPGRSSDFIRTLCYQASVEINGNFYNSFNTNGQEVFPNGSVNGCDSTVYISLSFYPPAPQLSVTRYTCNPAFVGVVTQTAPNANGCDQQVTTTTLLDAAARDTTKLTAYTCDAANAGVSQVLLLNTAGCDSLVIKTTVYLPSDTTFSTVNTCNPALVGVASILLHNIGGCDSLVIRTTVFSNSGQNTTNLTQYTCNPALAGVTQVTLSNINGCDSIVVKNTILNPTNAVTVNKTTCIPSLAGTQIKNLTNQYGCDSIVTIITALVPKSTTSETKYTCNPTQVGTWVTTLTNIGGCDSVVTTTYLFNATAVDTTRLIANTCKPALAGVKQVLYPGVDGCDSLVITTTNLLRRDSTYQTRYSCRANQVGLSVVTLTNRIGCDSLLFISTLLDVTSKDTTYLTKTTCNPALAGVSQNLLIGFFGCDSLIITTTTLKPSSANSITKYSCNPTQVGITTLTLVNFVGCDSILTINTLLDVNARDTTYLTAKTCNPSQAGITQNLLVGVDGCDSLIITTTTIKPSSTNGITKYTCNPANVGVMTQTLVNYVGCDSILTITTLFDINARDTTYLTKTTCVPSQAGISQSLLVGFDGCDSLIITTTTLKPSSTKSITKYTCNPANVGIITQTLVNYVGCDSILTITTLFDINARDTTYLTKTTCVPSQAGISQNLLVGFDGCDSLIITTTTLKPSSTKSITKYTCNPANVGVMTQTLVNYVGCDSILTITTLFDINARDTTYLTKTTCVPSQAGISQNLLVGFDGCDSLIITTTTLKPSSTKNVTKYTCNPANVGVMTQTLVNYVGCDSILTITTLFDVNAVDTSYVNGVTCNPTQVGITQILLSGSSGCDSLVIKNTTLVDKDTTYAIAVTCDPALVGLSSLNLTNQNGCDSLIITNTTFGGAACGFVAVLTGSNVSCFGVNDGVISIIITSGVGPFNYQWTNNQNGINGVGNISGINQTETITGLQGGTYSVQIGAISAPIDTQTYYTVQVPFPMTGLVTATSQYNGYNISCAGENDGAAQAQGAGGSPPFQYQWSNGATTPSIQNLPVGWTYVSIIDANGCLLPDSLLLNAPPTLNPKLRGGAERCADSNDGFIEVTEANAGNIAGLMYSINGGPFGSNGLFTGLPPGDYNIMVTDLNGCTGEASTTVAAGENLIFEAGLDTTILSGDSVLVTLQSNHPLDTVIWQPNTGIAGLDMLHYLAKPQGSTQYFLTAIDTNGCVSKDQLRVIVKLDRKIYVPNVIYPDNPNGTNQGFTIFADEGVVGVDLLRIYDRWGNLVSEQKDFPINDPTSGWFGKYPNGKAAHVGVYVFYAVLRLNDGRQMFVDGDVTVVR